MHRALCEATIAEPAGVEPNLVKMWMDDLSSMLYRGGGTNGGIRVRHASVADFFVSNDCSRQYRVDAQEANRQVGIACLKTMVSRLRFNVRGLVDSPLANADVNDLPSRITDSLLVGSPLFYSRQSLSAGVGRL